MKLMIIVLAMVATGAGAFHSWYNRNLYVKAALLSEAYNLTAPVKLHVSDHYLKHGVMPHDNNSAQLPPPVGIYGTSVKRVAINRGGVLSVDFDVEIGKQSMTFTPTVSPTTGLIEWRCSSDSIERAVLEKLKPNCAYLPASKESLLMSAIANQQLEAVDQHLNTGAMPDAVVNGNTPLMLAAKIGSIPVVKRLLQAGAKIDNSAINAERRTPLMVAITSDNSEVVALLLSEGASAIRRDYRGLTAMDHAVATDRRLGGERYMLMVSASLNPNFAGNPVLPMIDMTSREEREKQLQGIYSEFHLSAKFCHVKRLASLLKAENDYLENEEFEGLPFDFYTSKPQCKDTLNRFLQTKKSYQESLNAYLSQQVRKCNLKQIELVLKQNPSFSLLTEHRSRDFIGRTISAGCSDVINLMVRHSPELAESWPEDILVNAIKLAPQSAIIKTVANLIEAGANVDGQSKGGHTPLSVAISLEQPVIAKYLIDAGANVNVKTSNQSYPIIEASKKGYDHLVAEMVELGADLDSQDSLGRTALISAVERAREQMVNTLIKAGASTATKDVNGIDAVLLAETRGLGNIKQRLMVVSAE